jgi:hypothetical protein
MFPRLLISISWMTLWRWSRACHAGWDKASWRKISEHLADEFVRDLILMMMRVLEEFRLWNSLASKVIT